MSANSIVIVIGLTPPGTGVMHAAFRDTRLAIEVDADVDYDSAGLHHLRYDSRPLGRDELAIEHGFGLLPAPGAVKL